MLLRVRAVTGRRRGARAAGRVIRPGLMRILCSTCRLLSWAKGRSARACRHARAALAGLGAGAAVGIDALVDVAAGGLGADPEVASELFKGVALGEKRPAARAPGGPGARDRRIRPVIPPGGGQVLSPENQVGGAGVKFSSLAQIADSTKLLAKFSRKLSRIPASQVTPKCPHFRLPGHISLRNHPSFA